VGPIPHEYGRSVSAMQKLLKPFGISVSAKLNDATTAVVAFDGAKGTVVLSKWERPVMNANELTDKLQKLAKAFGGKAGSDLEALVTPPRPAQPPARRPAPPASRGAAPCAVIRPAAASDAARELCRKYADKKQCCPKCMTFPALKVYRNKHNMQYFVKCVKYCSWYSLEHEQRQRSRAARAAGLVKPLPPLPPRADINEALETMRSTRVRPV
jgi:hypothetical protein